MDEFNKMRKSYFSRGENRNHIAKKFHRSWQTVDRVTKMDRDELKSRGKRPNRDKPIITPQVTQTIERYLEEEELKRVKKKQRYTAQQIYSKLMLEKPPYKGSLRSVEREVKRLRAKRNQTKTPSFLPLDFPLGSALQIDHGEVDIEIKEVRIKGYLFVASVPGQVLRYCQVFPTKASEAWGEFHEKSFQFFGGIFSRVIYDNDTVLVKKIIGNDRKQTSFSLSLEEHYGFESHFCNVASGNEKGAVENGVGYCRRRFLASLPSFKSWESANELLSSCCLKDIETGLHYKTQEKLSDLFDETKDKLSPLPPKKVWCRWIDCRVDKCQLVTIDHHQYSIPEKFVGSLVRAALTISTTELFKDGELVAVHPRVYGKEDSLKLDHYLDQLQRKPSAFCYAKAVTQSDFHPKLKEMWNRLSEKYGSKEANRQFVSILLLRRQWSQKELLKGVKEALHWGAIDYAAVETSLRQRQLSATHINYEELHSFIPTSSMKWDFNLSSYAELCKEIAL